jgi:hypothetical protein
MKEQMFQVFGNIGADVDPFVIHFLCKTERTR